MPKIRGWNSGGASLALNLVRRPDDDRPWLVAGEGRRAPLPSGIDYASGELGSLTPSLTYLMLRFVVADENSTTVDDALRREYRTLVVPRRAEGHTTFTHGDPFFAKRAECKRARDRLVQACEKWFADFFPGEFSARHAGLPSCELITFREAVPFVFEQGRDFRHYVSALGMDREYETWKSEAIPGVVLSSSPTEDLTKEWLHMILAGKFDAIAPSVDMKMYGGRTRSGLVRYLEGFVDPLLTLSAVNRLLVSYNGESAETRDAAEHILSSSARRAVGQVENLRRNLLRRWADIAVVCSDLKTATADNRKPLWARGVDVWKPAGDEYHRLGIPEPALADSLVEGIAHYAESVSEGQEMLATTLTTSVSLLAAEANLRLQRWVLALSGLVVVVTVVLGLLTYWAATAH